MLWVVRIKASVSLLLSRVLGLKRRDSSRLSVFMLRVVDTMAFDSECFLLALEAFDGGLERVFLF